MLLPFRRPPQTLPAELQIAGRVVPLVVTRRAVKRLTLRADAVHGVVRLTLPPRGNVPEALRLVEAHRDWLAARVAKWPQQLRLEPGAAVPFDGGMLMLDWSAAHPRGVVRIGDRLRLGGAAETVPGRTLRWLRAEALTAMEPPTRALAAQIARPVASVTVRDPATRWGSCRGGALPAINYSWRLILAPPWVRHSVVAHEVAHLVHPNHGAEFWALAAELNGGSPAPARAWLSAHGPALHWVGKS